MIMPVELYLITISKKLKVTSNNSHNHMLHIQAALEIDVLPHLTDLIKFINYSKDFYKFYLSKLFSLINYSCSLQTTNWLAIT